MSVIFEATSTIRYRGYDMKGKKLFDIYARSYRELLEVVVKNFQRIARQEIHIVFVRPEDGKEGTVHGRIIPYTHLRGMK